MIVVKLEIWPYGDESLARTIGQMRIHNDGTGSLSRGNYEYQLLGKKGKLMSRGSVRHYARNAQHPWNLILKVLDGWKSVAD